MFAHAGVVLGSFHESRGIAPSVFAALATGAPVITGDTEGARELLRDGESALLVPPEDPGRAGHGTRPDRRRRDAADVVAARGRQAFELHATRAVRGRKWRALLEDLLT